MTRRESWDMLAEALDARRQLWCAGCGGRDDRRERGWTLHLDDEGELHTLCPACGSRFGLRPSG
jgi:hypothetical protein